MSGHVYRVTGESSVDMAVISDFVRLNFAMVIMGVPRRAVDRMVYYKIPYVNTPEDTHVKKGPEGPDLVVLKVQYL